MNSDHLSSKTIGAFIDLELPHSEYQEALTHLRDCHSCALGVLEAHHLKGAVRLAARRFAPSAEAIARLSSVTKERPRAQVIPLRPVLWTAAAAILLAVLFLGGLRKSAEQGALTADLLDQHLALLSDTSAPQVISTDRHTVKPWFQGKLPFSFNLPEPAGLPADTVLQGADFTYVEGKPTALLLFTIHKHRASVFVSQGSRVVIPEVNASHSGFNISFADARSLSLAGVSDVNQSELDALVNTLAKVQ